MQRRVKLVIFDLDGTLTTVDNVWGYLHEALGTLGKARVSAERYRRGLISYADWASGDAQCWAGVELSKLNSILERIPYRKGTTEVFDALKRSNVKIAILSAGISILAEKAARELGADMVLSNELIAFDGCLTGDITVKVPLNNKRDLVEAIASRFGFPLRDIALIGDHGNDLAQPECLRIAIDPGDDLARQRADFIVEDADLRGILEYIRT